jgi:hypothetical protein
MMKNQPWHVDEDFLDSFCYYCYYYYYYSGQTRAGIGGAAAEFYSYVRVPLITIINPRRTDRFFFFFFFFFFFSFSFSLVIRCDMV